MVDITKYTGNLGNREGDEAGGDGGKGQGGKGGGGKGGAGFIPTFDDLIGVTPEEAEIAQYAKDALFSNRVSLKAQGEKVNALDRKQKFNNSFDDPRMAAELAQGGGPNLEEHPELPELGGAFDDIVFPEIEAEAAASNDPQLRNELKNRLGMGMSKEALKYEYEKKNKEKLNMSSRPAPDQKPEYVIRPAAPPPRPRPF